MRNRVGSLTTRRPGSPSGAIGRRGNIRQSPGMNGRAADVAVANATPPDLHGPRPRESPIGAWATPDNADAATAPKTTQIPGDHPTTALNPHATHLIDPPTTMRLAHAPKPTRRRPEQFKQQPSRRPRRIPIDFSLLIGGTQRRSWVSHTLGRFRLWGGFSSVCGPTSIGRGPGGRCLRGPWCSAG
jgi:hypothetical protein